MSDLMSLQILKLTLASHIPIKISFDFESRILRETTSLREYYRITFNFQKLILKISLNKTKLQQNGQRAMPKSLSSFHVLAAGRVITGELMNSKRAVERASLPLGCQTQLLMQ